MNKVLIAVTTYNQLEMTKKCLSYLEKLGHDILVIDDCSTDGTPSKLFNRYGVKAFDLYPKDERKGLTDSWNIAYDIFKDSDFTHLILMNNDVLIPKGAIENMLSDYPLVVPRTNPKGAGYACKGQAIEGSVLNYEADAENPDNMQKIQDFMGFTGIYFNKASCWTGFCMCFSRKIIEYEREDGNLFDHSRINVGNDDDLASRVPCQIALGSFVYHFKGKSFNNQITGRNDLSRTY